MSIVTPGQRMEALSVESTQNAGDKWRLLYRVGGATALLSVVVVALAIGVFLLWPPPSAMTDWFALFHRNGFLGLLDADLLLVVSYALTIPFYLALFVALRRANQSLMVIALTFSLLGAALILSANPGVGMLTLSGQYAAATSEAQRALYLAAGQAIYTNWSGSAFVLGYLFGGVATLLFSFAMLRSPAFGKTIGYVGLAMGVLMLVPASAGTVGLYVSLVSLAPTVVWLALAALKLFALSGPFGVGGESFVVAHPRGRHA
ncbi:MAG TPA: DUF4386 family protein [Ktedonobacterales bacterium]